MDLKIYGTCMPGCLPPKNIDGNCDNKIHKMNEIHKITIIN